MIEVKKDIMMPIFLKRGERQAKYPFSDLNAGEYFDFPEDISPGTASGALTVANKKFAPKKFKKERLSNKAYRVWRVE